jgi:membrane-bound lytic murein transglycosylase B
VAFTDGTSDVEFDAVTVPQSWTVGIERMGCAMADIAVARANSSTASDREKVEADVFITVWTTACFWRRSRRSKFVISCVMRQYAAILMISLAAVVTVVLGVAVLSTSLPGPAAAPPPVVVKRSMLGRALDVVTARGVDSAFAVRLITDPETQFNKSLVRINVTNFTLKPNYAHNYDAAGVRRVRGFIREHDSVLSACEAQYGVPKEVIASIIWVETKYGRVLGRHHLPSVYLSVALASEPEFIEQNLQAVIGDSIREAQRIDSVRALITAKAQRKTKWAIEQIKAMEVVERQQGLDILSLRGSWAGAFGLPQFLPSSYQRWARDGNNDGRIDLFNLTDAMHSVGNYLRSNGWADTDESHKAAVRHYNNSSAYVHAVLTLAEKAR